MNISEIMQLISEEEIERLGHHYKIDKINNKITGKFILKSFVKCALMGYKMSLRGIETICNNRQELLAMLKTNAQTRSIDHSSIGKRLKAINIDYFEAIYKALVSKYNERFAKNDSNKFHRFDSTLINISGKLLKDGLNLGGKTDDKQIKLSFGLKHSIPSSVRFCTEQAESSEDIALVRAINEAKLEKEDIILFDRGIASANTFKNLTQEEKQFITRINVNRCYELVKTKEVILIPNSDLEIISDEIVNLYARKKKKINNNVRLIKARNKQGDELWFLTNIMHLSSYDIASIYKRRWDIEVFFKFLKQHLQFKHFISYNQNGMQVYIYCLLIAAILFVIFKITNKLSGFKIALLQFTLMLEKEIIKDIVIFSGGNPELVELRL